MVPVDVDGLTDVTTTASSRSTLTLPAGATVNRAWIVWGSQSVGGVSAADYRNVQLISPADPTPVPYTANAASVGNAVHAIAEVTEQVRGAGAGVYTFGSIGGYADIGTNRSGGWTLVVQYDRSTDPMRTLVVLDGLVHIAGSEQRIALGVLGGDLPAEGAKARIGLVSWDGDQGVTGDSATVTSGATPTAVELADALNPVNDVFNSTISVGGFLATGRTPNLPNTLGFDADLFDVTVYGGGAATLTVTSVDDAIDLGLVTLSIPV